MPSGNATMIVIKIMQSEPSIAVRMPVSSGLLDIGVVKNA